MALLAPLPCGFIEAMDTLCLLPPAAATAALAVFRAEQAQAPIAELFQELVAASCAAQQPPPPSLRALLSAQRALEHIYRRAASTGVTAAALRDALSTFLLPAGPTCTALCGAYEEASAAGSALEVAASRPLPSLASLSCQLLVERASWQAGGVRSDVPRPFVEATVRTRHRERGASSYSLRLSLPEFKELAKAVRALRDAEAAQTQAAGTAEGVEDEERRLAELSIAAA